VGFGWVAWAELVRREVAWGGDSRNHGERSTTVVVVNWRMTLYVTRSHLLPSWVGVVWAHMRWCMPWRGPGALGGPLLAADNVHYVNLRREDVEQWWWWG